MLPPIPLPSGVELQPEGSGGVSGSQAMAMGKSHSLVHEQLVAVGGKSSMALPLVHYSSHCWRRDWQGVPVVVATHLAALLCSPTPGPAH